MNFLKLVLLISVFLSIEASLLPGLFASKNANQETRNGFEEFIQSRVNELENLVKVLEQKLKTFLPSFDSLSPKTNPRTCLEILLADRSAPSGQYVIDPDGLNGDPAINVYCNMTTGATLVGHDSESPIRIAQCSPAGCYNRTVTYNATIRQMETLSNLSKTCHQYIKFNCLGIPFEFNGARQAWWIDRNGNNRTYWAGPASNTHTCQCGIDSKCIDSSVKCNCDALAPETTFDDGYVTEKSALPVTRLHFGRSISQSSIGIHTLGKLECSGQATLEGPPKSCADLWQVGYTLNGYYTVKGSNSIRTVLCDFSKLPDEEGQEVVVGEDDVKSKLVYFFAIRGTAFSGSSVPIPFEKVELNEGEAFDDTTGVFTAPLSGIYFFTASFPRSTVGLYLDGEVVVSSTDALTATLSVNANQTIHLQGAVGSSLLFNGALLQEQFPSEK